ncbi:YbbR family protein [Thermodesulfobacterium geofontis OPF15]|jgi:YbbR domain-containing protein|uniref:YbbR family protein n=1 Tax=Thermodesulfobacterium geofontis (strain OPF15) TaxID=795359 RepID=F8C2P7_THEGP|nr:CdaR family protein [Thermodesulfobacterium geofontis]AEH23448.1 YbbR family protein [Thermodesulfobacterium geofontis OPF15]
MKFKREHKLKIISFFLAIILWYFVVLGKPIEKELEIPIIRKNFNPNYLVELNPSEVVLKVEATRRILRNFPSNNLKLEIDLSKYPPGVHQIRVPIEKLNLPSDLKIKELKPDSITLIIKRLDVKKVPVKPIYETEENFPKRFKLIIKPSYVVIKAPIEVLVNTYYITTQPLDILKLKIKKEVEAELAIPPGVISVYPEKVKVIYHE